MCRSSDKPLWVSHIHICLFAVHECEELSGEGTLESAHPYGGYETRCWKLSVSSGQVSDALI